MIGPTLQQSHTPVSRSVSSQLGPGLITGAADDDPSGIATYSQAGAQFGPALLWLNLYSLPLMVAVQMLSARLGRITGRGMAANIRAHFGQGVLVAAVFALLVANTLNIAADLAAMGDALQLLVGGGEHGHALVFGAGLLLLQVFVPYRRLVVIFKWLTMALLAYAMVLFFAHVQWWDTLLSILVPKLRMDASFGLMIMAVLGTTISPYLFFWQSSQEVEDTREEASEPLLQRPDSRASELDRITRDTWFGMGFSNLIALCIMLTGSAVLNAAHVTEIRTSAQAAEALRPLAGDYAFVLFAAGVIGTGLLAVPVLAGSSGYAVAEAFGWKEGLRLKLHEARGFYAVVTIATLGGVLIDFTPLDPIKALIWSAVLNGVVAVPLLVLLLLLSGRASVVGDMRPSPLLRFTGWFAVLVMGTVALVSLVSFVVK